MQPDSIEEITKRTQRYWYEDGLWEIAFGLANALLAVFYLLMAHLNTLGVGGGILVLLQMAVIVAAFGSMGRLVKFFKERITYPRTGYVAYRKPAPMMRFKRILRVVFLSAGMAALVSAVAVIRMNQDLNLTALVTGMLMAAALVYFGYRFGLARMYLVAGLTITLGFALSFIPMPDNQATSIFFGAFGLLMILSGGLSLALYLHNTRVVNEDQSDDESFLENR